MDPTGKGVNFTGRGVDLPIGIYISHIDIAEQCLDIDNTALGIIYGIFTLIIIMLSITYIVLTSLITEFYLTYTAEGKHLERNIQTDHEICLARGKIIFFNSMQNGTVYMFFPAYIILSFIFLLVCFPLFPFVLLCSVYLWEGCRFNREECRCYREGC